MNIYLSIGIFAFYVGFVSLVGLTADRETPTVLAAKRYWGRKRGLTLHFLVNIALPVIFGIVFISRGVVGFDPAETERWHAVTSLVAMHSADVRSGRGSGLSSPLSEIVVEKVIHPTGELYINPVLSGYP